MCKLRDYQRCWDGSEVGWKVCQYKDRVWLLDFTFDESGPTGREFEILVEFFPPYPGETINHMRKKFRGCCGWATGRPISRMSLVKLKRTDLRIAMTEVSTEHHLLLMPDDRHYLIYDASIREEVAQKMVEAGVEIEMRELD